MEERARPEARRSWLADAWRNPWGLSLAAWISLVWSVLVSGGPWTLWVLLFASAPWSQYSIHDPFIASGDRVASWFCSIGGLLFFLDVLASAVLLIRLETRRGLYEGWVLIAICIVILVLSIANYDIAVDFPWVFGRFYMLR